MIDVKKMRDDLSDKMKVLEDELHVLGSAYDAMNALAEYGVVTADKPPVIDAEAASIAAWRNALEPATRKAVKAKVAVKTAKAKKRKYTKKSKWWGKKKK